VEQTSRKLRSWSQLCTVAGASPSANPRVKTAADPAAARLAPRAFSARWTQTAGPATSSSVCASEATPPEMPASSQRPGVPRSIARPTWWKVRAVRKRTSEVFSANSS
jgi:hypothetical protein